MFFKGRLKKELAELGESLLFFKNKENCLDNSIVTMSLNMSGEITGISNAFYSLFGYSRTELIGRDYSIICSKNESSSSAYRNMWLDLLKGITIKGLFLRKGKGEREIWAEITHTPIIKNTSCIGVSVHIADVTERERACFGYKAVIDAINRSNAIIEFKPNGIVIGANEQFMLAMGYSRIEEIMGKHHEMFCSDQFYKKNPDFWVELSKGKVKQGLFERIGRKGNSVWIEASYNPVFGHDGTVTKIIKVARDITERVSGQASIHNAAEIAHSTATETTQVSERGARILQESIHNSSVISSDIERSAELIDALNAQSEQISEIVTTIKSIADQTNLLGLCSL